MIKEYKFNPSSRYELDEEHRSLAKFARDHKERSLSIYEMGYIIRELNDRGICREEILDELRIDNQLYDYYLSLEI